RELRVELEVELRSLVAGEGAFAAGCVVFRRGTARCESKDREEERENRDASHDRPSKQEVRLCVLTTYSRKSAMISNGPRVRWRGPEAAHEVQEIHDPLHAEPK